MPALVILRSLLSGNSVRPTLGSILIGSLNSVLVYMLVKKFFFEDNKGQM